MCSQHTQRLWTRDTQSACIVVCGIAASRGLKSVIQLVRGKKFCIIKDGTFFLFEKSSSKKPCASFLLQGTEQQFKLQLGLLLEIIQVFS